MRLVIIVAIVDELAAGTSHASGGRNATAPYTVLATAAAPHAVCTEETPPRHAGPQGDGIGLGADGTVATVQGIGDGRKGAGQGAGKEQRGLVEMGSGYWTRDRACV